MKEVIDFRVLKIEHFESEDYLLDITPVGKSLLACKPGQFVNILIEDSPTTFLRRPISIGDIDEQKNTMSLYIKQVGGGTRKLATLKKNDIVNIIYPLGNGFTSQDIQSPLLVGGGTGMAPMLYLCKHFNKLNIKPHVLLGGRTKAALSFGKYFSDIAHLHITTEDGSLGEKGVVTSHSIFQEISTFDRVYTCGPSAMMKAVAQKAEAARIPCEVSLENTMACGFGVCLCCVTSTTTGNRCVCTEGPVFLSTELTEF